MGTLSNSAATVREKGFLSMNNSKVWLPIITLLFAIGGAYLSAQVAVTDKLGEKASRQELKEAVNDTREQIRRELDDIKRRQEQTMQELQEINQLLRAWMQKNKIEVTENERNRRFAGCRETHRDASLLRRVYLRVCH